MKILANDGMDAVGQRLLEAAGFTVDTQNIPQDQLAERLQSYDAITVRSATKVRKELIDQCPNLKLIGRGGVGMDNIDVDYAISKGIAVVNTPAASSLSVAELVFSHLMSGVRFLHAAHREMPMKGSQQFNELKKAYTKGVELRGKTLGVVGFGRIGKATAAIGLGLGMDVLYYDLHEGPTSLLLTLSGGINVEVPVNQVSYEDILKKSDFISFHVPFAPKALLGAEEFALLKNGVGLVNASRGGVIDEQALLENLDNGKVAFVGLDVFDNEPTPLAALIQHPRVSATPHIGASTLEAQERIGEELANLIIQHLQK
jgi:D-3-phosphoglycerate dehydrogenase